MKVLKGEASRVEVDKFSRDEWKHIPRPDRTSPEAIQFLSRYKYFLGDRKATTMLTGLGCSQQCKFCEEMGTQVRWSSLETISQELDDIIGLGYKGVYIFDDLFAISLKKTRPICEELAKRDLAFRCNGHARYFNDEFAQVLNDTGCYEIAFGAESGSQKMLDTMCKKTTVQQNYGFVALCKKYGIHCKAFLMLGLPGENFDTIKETEEFIKNSGIEDFQLSIFYPYKGTEFRRMMDEGIGIDLFFEHEGLGAYGQKGGSTEAIVRTAALNQEDLLNERNRLVNIYKPTSHKSQWATSTEDSFFDAHLQPCRVSKEN